MGQTLRQHGARNSDRMGESGPDTRWTADVRHPVRCLAGVFVGWKALLLLVAVGSGLGPAYDTSSTLMMAPSALSSHEACMDVATKLSRWDAIYFVQAARRGRVYEHEWAFGPGFPAAVALLSRALRRSPLAAAGASVEATVGIVIAHASHLLSVLVLYLLTVKLWRDEKLALVTAILHVLSPAGLFLSAPYAESSFAFLSFTGYLLFAHVCTGWPRSVTANGWILGSGLVLGLATTFRSNGLLNGIPFLVFVLPDLSEVVGRGPNLANLTHLVALGLGGLSVAAGYAVPQLIAYQTFCSQAQGAEIRPWCRKRVPSIYTFVQEHYWNVGFLRYWTLSNLPLFLLAAPMLYLLIRSGLDFAVDAGDGDGTDKVQRPRSPSGRRMLIRAMALTQLILAALAITNYHVQIITRISSGYPVWYWWLARRLADPKRSSLARAVVTWMVMYAAVQGALFAAFLPPA